MPRDRSITLYRAWLRERLAARDPNVRCALARIVRAARRGPVTLLCWCAPLPCHAEVVAETVRAILADAGSRRNPR